MNRTIEDSKKGYDIVCMSYSKEKQRGKGIKVVKAGKKDSFIEADSKELKTKNSELFENNKLEEETGNIIVNFADYKKAKENNENRITEFAIEKAIKEGRLVKIEEAKKKRAKTDNEQVI